MNAFSPIEPRPRPDRRTDRLLKLPDVIRRTTLGRTTIYKQIGEGRFPAPVPLSSRRVGWYLSDIEAYIADPANYHSI